MEGSKAESRTGYCNHHTRKLVRIWFWLLGCISLATIFFHLTIWKTNLPTVSQALIQPLSLTAQSLTHSLTANQSLSLSQSAAKKHFGSVLFIVKYNYHAPFELVILHSSFWSAIFEHQLILVPYDSTTLQSAIDKIGNAGVELVSCLDKDELGHFAYSSILVAMALHPHYEGYLYTHDDMALSITKLMGLDLKSYWITDYNPSDAYNTISPTNLDSIWNMRNHTWGWFNRNVGIDAMQSAIDKNPSLRQSLVRCTGTERRWFYGQSDFLFVPQHQKTIYMDIMGKLADAKVFLEIALPTFIACFTPKNLVEKIVLCNFWDSNRGNVSYMNTNCPPSTSAYHPVKLSGRDSLQFMIRKTGITFDMEIQNMSV